MVKNNNLVKIGVIACLVIIGVGVIVGLLKPRTNTNDFGYETIVQVFTEKCVSEGLAFQYMTQGGQIRCENEVQGKFYDISYALKYSYDISDGNITWRDVNGGVMETRKVEYGKRRK